MAHAFTLQFIKHLFLIFFDLNVPNERIGLRLEVDCFVFQLVGDAQLNLTLKHDLWLSILFHFNLDAQLGEEGPEG